MQQYAGIYLLQNYSTRFGCPSHPSSEVHKTVTAAFGTGHIIWATAFLRGLIRPRWRKVVAQILWSVPEVVVTVLCTPDDGCDEQPKCVEYFAVNKYLHTVASCWIFRATMHGTMNIKDGNGIDKDSSLLEYDAVYSGIDTYCGGAPASNFREVITVFWIPWRQREHALPERLNLHANAHGVIYQKNGNFNQRCYKTSIREMKTTNQWPTLTAVQHLTPKGRSTHRMPRPCRSPAMPCVNSHMPCRAPALLRQCRVLRECPHGSRKYPNC